MSAAFSWTIEEVEVLGQFEMRPSTGVTLDVR